jgi:uncharacterized protein YegP (UPF0339 family)
VNQVSTARQRKRFEIYPIFTHHQLTRFPDVKQRWQWRLLAANNHVMADSGNNFESVRAARKSIKRIRSMMHLAGVIVFDSKGKVNMKPETKVWLKCESIGRPADTLVTNCTAREAMKALAQWILTTYMGSKIRIIMARSEAELADDRRSAAHNDVMADLESILGPEAEESDGRS